jgi:hypothetical protein
MEMIILALIASIVSGFAAYEFGLEGIVQTAFYVEDQFTNLGIGGTDFLFELFFGYGVSLIILKFLKKGFDTYILWVDGDADSDPMLLLTNFFRAMAVAIAFPTVYGWFVEILEKASTDILESIGLNIGFDITVLSNLITQTFLTSIFCIIFLIIFVMVYIKILGVGVEILILRVGLPLACGGLMDADRGVFRSYIQKFIQSFFTVLIQLILLKFGMALMLNGHVIWGIVFAMMALKTPRFLQEFLIVSSGGGGLNGIYQSARMVQMARTAFKVR